MTEAMILDAVRTASARGKPGGALSGWHPVDLLAEVLAALVERNGMDPGVVDDVIGGCVGQAGEQAINVTRSAVLAAGFPETVPATTVDRQCGSSQQAAQFAAHGVLAGQYDVVIACGIELMSRVPMGSTPLGLDPWGPRLRERYDPGLVNQGVSAELIAARWKLGRRELDELAARSHERAEQATNSGAFEREILPVRRPDVGLVHDRDETVRAGTTVEGLAALKPAFYDAELGSRFPEIDWAITAGNSSQLADGASAVLIASHAGARKLGLRPRARFHSFAVVGSDPITMLTGPIPATQKVLARSGLAMDDVDAYEVNEAFASVTLAWQRELGADPARLNPRGGAIALGHPLGASGGRLLTTLLCHLEDTGGRYGLQTMCEGGGMANATIIECL